MAPNFSLTGDNAVAQVLPVDQLVTRQVLSVLGVGFGIGLPSTSTTSSIVTAVPTGAQSGTVTNSVNPGTAPTVPTGIPTGAALPPAISPGTAISVDPMMKYQAASALFQAVQLLNRQVQNAALLQCYVPYLVMLKLGVTVNRPNMPYNIQTRASFFPNTEHKESTSAGKNRAALSRSILRSANASLSISADCSSKEELPFVVPILATDDIERALTSRAVETAAQIGLAASAMIHGVGLAGNFNNVRQNLDSVLGSDYNTRLTVLRENWNTLHVRIGATAQGTSKVALVGQNYDIATILLVPRAYFPNDGSPFPTLSVYTFTQLQNAKTGIPLPERPSLTLINQVEEGLKDTYAVKCPYLISQWERLSPEEKLKISDSFRKPIQQGSLEKWNKLWAPLPKKVANVPSDPQRMQMEDDKLDLNACDGDREYSPALWTYLTSILTDDPFKTQNFQLRQPVTIATNLPRFISGAMHPTAIIIDDGKNAQIQVQNVTGTSGASLLATLIFGGSSRKQEVMGSPAIDPSTHILTVTFPSLAKINKTAVGGSAILHLEQKSPVVEEIYPDLDFGRNFPQNIRRAPNDQNSLDLSVLPWPIAASDANAVASTASAKPTIPAAPKAATPNPPNLTISAEGSTPTPIIITHGTGRLGISVSHMTDPSAVITVFGVAPQAGGKPAGPVGGLVQVTGAKDGSGAIIPVSNNSIVVGPSNAGTIVLSLSNLTSNSVVYVQAEGFSTPPGTAGGSSTGVTPALKFTVSGS